MSVNLHKQSVDLEPAAPVLVIGEDPIVAAALSAALRGAGHVVIAARSAQRALDVCAKQPFQLAIIDERLADMTTAQLTCALRNRYALPAVLLSAFENPKLIAAATDAGALGVIVKPLDLACMLPDLQNFLSRAQEPRRLQTRADNSVRTQYAPMTRLRRWRKQVMTLCGELLSSGSASSDIEAAILRSRTIRNELRTRKPEKSVDSNY
jgi:DNA-binding NtrC family response regulator